jgi:hypothetical protein
VPFSVHYVAFWETFSFRCRKLPVDTRNELSILGTLDFRNCKSLPPKVAFGCAQVYFKTGFRVFFSDCKERGTSAHKS